MQKTIFFILYLFCVKTPFFAQNTAVVTAKTAVEPIAWNTVEHDFGDIPQGRTVSFDFKFTNNTADSIEIENIRTTCGCTAATWQEPAIQPTQTTIIPVQFDAEEIGYFEKKIRVYLRHIKKPFVLIITGEVK